MKVADIMDFPPVQQSYVIVVSTITLRGAVTFMYEY